MLLLSDDNAKSAAKSEPVVGIYHTLQVQFPLLPCQSQSKASFLQSISVSQCYASCCIQLLSVEVPLCTYC